MPQTNTNRREILKCGAAGAAAACCWGGLAAEQGRTAEGETRRGAQRLSVARLQQFEALGYRTFLYEHIARLQPNVVVLMNGGFHDGTQVPVDSVWPTDLLSPERTLPSKEGYPKWKTVEGKEYYLPGEFCDSIKPPWWWVEGEKPRHD